MVDGREIVSLPLADLGQRDTAALPSSKHRRDNRQSPFQPQIGVRQMGNVVGHRARHGRFTFAG